MSLGVPWIAIFGKYGEEHCKPKLIDVWQVSVAKSEKAVLGRDKGRNEAHTKVIGSWFAGANLVPDPAIRPS